MYFQPEMFCIFIDQHPLNRDEAIQVEGDEPSIEELISLLEKKTGTKIDEHDMRPEVDVNLATKFGQKTVSGSHVCINCQKP